MEIEPDLSVCVAGPRKQESLAALLHSLYATADRLAVEAVVVTGSRTADALQETFPQALLYEAEQEAPLMAAGNQAMRLARGRYLALVTSAVVFQAGALARLLTFLDDRPEVGLASAAFQAMEGAGIPVAGHFPGLPRFLADFAWSGAVRRACPGFLDIPAFSREVDWLCSPCLLIRRELIEDIGPPAESGGPLWSLDYCWRARRAGWKAFFLREALVLCDRRPDLFHRPASLLVDAGRYFGRKWGGWL